MLIVREVSTADLDSLWQLIGQVNAGMTSLKVDKDQLFDRIELAHFAFRRSMERPEGAPYVFVIEDLATRRIVGTSCIFSRTGGFDPFYCYRVVTEQITSKLLGQTNSVRSLHLVKNHNGPTELGGLFLHPDFRGAGGGKLLSLSRFLYMAAHPKRFVDETIAEMRGYLNADNESPFWDAIGSHFFNVDFPRADALSMIDKQFIEDLMPRYPIYLDLLPQHAVESLGRVHDQTRPAIAMLESHGFVRQDYIDIFDGGPIVHCRTREIHGVAQSKPIKIQKIVEDNSIRKQSSRSIVSIENPRFSSALANLGMTVDGAFIEESVAKAMSIHSGDTVWYLVV